MLGRAQWRWLEERLAEAADIHLVVSSIQVIPEDHCFEKWANFPHERERLLQLLAVASAPALILSGDRHFAEISRIELPGARGALLELTSSGMNSAGAGKNDPNRHRALAPVVREDNFATLDLDWDSAGLRLGLAIRGTDGALLQQLQARYGRAD